MRSTNIAGVSYTPEPAPQDAEELRKYIENEFRKIAAALQRLQDGHLDVTYVAPAKPREGDIRLCDGTQWNPLGTGQKFVGYRGGSWRDLG